MTIEKQFSTSLAERVIPKHALDYDGIAGPFPSEKLHPGDK